MIFHHDELALAHAYEGRAGFEALTEDQTHAIMNRGRALFHWFKSHLALHYAISVTVFVVLFALDWWIQVRLPAWMLPAGPGSSTLSILAAAVLSGGVHSWLMYSVTVFSMHEGAAHKLIFPPQGPVSQVLHRISSQLGRLSGADPNYYADHHMAHHAKFGTEEDGEFLNFVKLRRYGLTFLPLATEIDYSDFIIHRAPGLTIRRFLSGQVALVYHGLFAWYAWVHFGPLFTIVSYLVVLPHVGFFVDRVRQFTEHNLMPLDNRNGSRSFGLGFWGLLVGGGPWGSPCHWEHHLVPSLPWYQQIVLHREVVGMLTPAQRRQFLIEPVIGFPKLWWRLVREARQFARTAPTPPAPGAPPRP